MRSKLTIACCLLLTAVVLHTCLRIEVLNARNGHFLPRSFSTDGNPKWRVTAMKPLVDSLEQTIAINRLNSHLAQHSDGPAPGILELSGPPYTDTEQALIDTEIARNTRNSELHAWVSSMGLLQYVLAPVSLLLSLALFRRTEVRAVRFTSFACLISNTASMCLMIYRGYFISLGW